MAPCPASEALRPVFRRSVRGRWSLVYVSGSSETHRFKAGYGSLRRVGLISTYCHRHVWNRNADLADTLRGWRYQYYLFSEMATGNSPPLHSLEIHRWLRKFHEKFGLAGYDVCHCPPFGWRLAHKILLASQTRVETVPMGRPARPRFLVGTEASARR